MARSESNEGQPTLLLVHLTGYSLLLFVLCDLIDVLIPPHIMDPVWEFESLGAVVERVPLPLLALVLVFYGEANFRAKWELTVLKLLSRACIVVGVLFLLLIPLCISNAVRINNINNDRVRAYPKNLKRAIALQRPRKSRLDEIFPLPVSRQ